MSRRIAMLMVVSIVCGPPPIAAAQLLPAGAATNADQPANLPGAHNGTIHDLEGCRCEVVFASDGVRVYVFGAAGKPVDVGNARGRVSLAVDGHRGIRHYDMYPQSTRSTEVNCLFAPADLSHIPDGAARATIALHGLDGKGRQRLSLVSTFWRTPTDDQLAVSRQRVCPVSGKPLGAMGTPIKVLLEERPVFVCCKNCVAPLKKHPARYLGVISGAKDIGQRRLR